MLPIVHFLLQKDDIVTEIMYLYRNGSGVNEHELCTPMYNPLIPGTFGLARLWIGV